MMRRDFPMAFEPVILPRGWRVFKIATVDRDPEMKYLPDGQAVANFSTANPPGHLGYANVSGPIWSVNVNERISTEITVRGKLAVICGKYLAKGQEIYIQGRLQTRRNADGERERVIFADAIYFAGAPPEAEIAESVGDDDKIVTLTRWLNYEELPEGVRAHLGP
jgi:single-strand DNA-binding protein